MYKYLVLYRKSNECNRLVYSILWNIVVLLFSCSSATFPAQKENIVILPSNRSVCVCFLVCVCLIDFFVTLLSLFRAWHRRFPCLSLSSLHSVSYITRLLRLFIIHLFSYLLLLLFSMKHLPVFCMCRNNLTDERSWVGGEKKIEFHQRQMKTRQTGTA